jgi:hypothetical protein
MNLDKLLEDIESLYEEAQDKALKSPVHPCGKFPEDIERLQDHDCYQYRNGFQDGVAKVRSMILKHLSYYGQKKII